MNSILNKYLTFIHLGNPKITLALVWTMILLWQETFRSNETSTSSPAISTSSRETPMISKMERSLLNWCRESSSSYNSTVQGSSSLNPPRVENFISSFSDGRVFLAILKKFHPHLVDDSLVNRMDDEPSRLLDYVFHQFEKIGVPRLLDPEDFVNITSSSTGGIDKKSVMTYVMCIFRKLHVPGMTSSSEGSKMNALGRPKLFQDGSTESEEKTFHGMISIYMKLHTRSNPKTMCFYLKMMLNIIYFF